MPAPTPAAVTTTLVDVPVVEPPFELFELLPEFVFESVPVWLVELFEPFEPFDVFEPFELFELLEVFELVFEFAFELLPVWLYPAPRAHPAMAIAATTTSGRRARFGFLPAASGCSIT